MGSLKDKVNKAIASKEAIRQAIVGKGVDVSEATPLADYAGKVEQIQSGGGAWKVPNGISFACSDLDQLPPLDLSSKTDFTDFFKECRGTSVPISDYPTAEIAPRFLEESRIRKVGNLSFPHATSIYRLFQSAQLEEVGEIDLPLASLIAQIFQNCRSLKSVQLLHVPQTGIATNMINGCPNLTYLEVVGIGENPRLETLAWIGAPNWGNEDMASTQGITGVFESLRKSLLDNSFDRATAGYTPATIQLAKEIEGRLNTADPTLINQIQTKGYTLTFA